MLISLLNVTELEYGYSFVTSQEYKHCKKSVLSLEQKKFKQTEFYKMQESLLTTSCYITNIVC